MASVDAQPCLVCREKTIQRCSACVKAGIDLFFCSTEHQKLVWFAHKAVCGPGKANPFVWPALTQAEVDFAKANPHASWPGGTTLTQALAGEFGTTTPDLLPSTLDSLGSTPTVPLSTNESKTRQEMNKLVRTYISYLRNESIVGPLVRASTPSARAAVLREVYGPDNFFSMLAGVLSSYGTLFLTGVDKPWLPTFPHRIVVRLALLHRHLSDASQGIEEYIHAVNGQLKTVITTEVMPLHPQLAREMLQALEMEDPRADEH
ncbi:hypothetical protein JCM10449v2_003473 [Rhodotorula kratochvilovae]